MNVLAKAVFILVLVVQIYGFPQTIGERNSFVVSRVSRQVQRDEPHNGKETTLKNPSGPPNIYEMRVEANITNRFAHSVVTSKVKNWAEKAQETVFSIVLPKDAFISKFVMSIGGKEYAAYVKGKKQAKQIYDQAIASGQGAGLVSASARESNRFTVSINVEPESKVIFYLTYEQLLQRKGNQYEMIINIHPKQPVPDLTVHVNINESQPLKFVKTPSIRSGNKINDVQGDLDPRAQIHMLNTNAATVSFSPNVERQKELASTLGTDAQEGLAGQFVVQYDVERNSTGGEILLNDGYFVHFFAPPGNKPLPKYILFVLDTSSSMSGTKIRQLQTAMKSILSELRSHDKFHLIEFSSQVKVRNIHYEDNYVAYPTSIPNYWFTYNINEDITATQFPTSNEVNPDNIKKAVDIVERLAADGGTNIADALKVALYLVDVDKRNSSVENAPQPMIIFLTDGDATVGERNSDAILGQVQEQNKHGVPIFSLSFGDGADKNLLQKLSLRNNGFSRHIYKAADASLQLQDFYHHISSPVLRNVTFKYVDDAKEVSKTTFPILFDGGEIVVVGRFSKEEPDGVPTVSATNIHGPILVYPKVKKSVSQLERLWAYKTIHQLLEDMKRSDNKTALEKSALDLALKYSFVTPVSSLVVVKPNATDSSITTVPADVGKKASFDSARPFYNHMPNSFGPTQRRMAISGPAGSSSFANFAVSQPTDLYDNVYDIVGTSYFMAPRPSSRNRAHSFARFGGANYMPQLRKFRTSTPPVPTTLAPVEELKSHLKWLAPVLENDIITTPQGTYKLGLNETSTAADHIPCPATPKNTPGICKLLHECHEVHDLLINLNIFQQYYCEMRGFAAVCCPNVPKN